jgi:lactoylglutathione lyase
MRLAKPHLDIGLFTNDIVRQTAFWSEEAALALDFKLKIDSNLMQHRYDAHGSVIKVNEARAPLPARAPSGYVELLIAHDGAERVLAHPGGDVVRLVPTGSRGVSGIGIVIRTQALAAMIGFYRDALGFQPEGEATLVAGDTRLFFVDGQPGEDGDDFNGPGFRYLTAQIFDADAAYATALAAGGRPGRDPVTLGDVARIAFVRDPDGNWIELSARRSLIGGTLPPNTPPATA